MIWFVEHFESNSRRREGKGEGLRGLPDLAATFTILGGGVASFHGLLVPFDFKCPATLGPLVMKKERVDKYQG